MRSLAERDKQLLWHPFTQEKIAPLPLAITRGEGAYLYDEKGKGYLDLVSSWWVNLHGHAHPAIAAAIAKQAASLEHVIFTNFTHEPAVQLCEVLYRHLGPVLKRFFFSDNGSTAVETGLKIAYQYWHNRGQAQRTLFLGLQGGYHGDTFGSMSVGVESGYHTPFHKLLFKSYPIPFPYTFVGDEDIEEKEERALQALDLYLANHASETAAFIAEPLLQGPAGMRMCRPSFLNKVARKVREAGLLIIYDEVMTGFGRTDTLFAHQQLDHMPDILCLAKGLTGGFLPLALTVTTEALYEAFLDDATAKALLHGHSYYGNPLGCAAANASLTLLESRSTQQAMHSIAQVHQEELSAMQALPHLTQARLLGTMAAFTVQQVQGKPFNGECFKRLCLAEGLILRPLGNTIYFLPPYCITEQELRIAYNKVRNILNQLEESSSVEGSIDTTLVV